MQEHREFSCHLGISFRDGRKSVAEFIVWHPHQSLSRPCRAFNSRTPRGSIGRRAASPSHWNSPGLSVVPNALHFNDRYPLSAYLQQVPFARRKRLVAKLINFFMGTRPYAKLVTQSMMRKSLRASGMTLTRISGCLTVTTGPPSHAIQCYAVMVNASLPREAVPSPADVMT